MRTLRINIINLFSFIGILSVFVTLLAITGFLLGILTPQKITMLLATAAAGIQGSSSTWWLIVLATWFAAGWASMYLLRTRTHPPIQIIEDETGVIEVTAEALCSLARMETRDQGISGKVNVDFTRRLGKPVLQIWCDLNLGGNGENPVELGEKLKKKIEIRLREDFNLKGIRVAVIHQPRSKAERSKTKKVA